QRLTSAQAVQPSASQHAMPAPSTLHGAAGQVRTASVPSARPRRLAIVLGGVCAIAAVIAIAFSAGRGGVQGGTAPHDPLDPRAPPVRSPPDPPHASSQAPPADAAVPEAALDATAHDPRETRAEPRTNI